MCSKDNFLQEVRALCIFTVILLHVPFQGHDNISFNTWLMSKQLITFPVAVFFFLSGYFYSFRNYKSRIVKLLCPFLFWNMRVHLIKFIRGESGFNIENFLLGNGLPYYYLAVLLQIVLFHYIIFKYWSEMVYRVLSISISIISLMAYYYFSISYSIHFNCYLYFPFWILFYTLGTFGKKYWRNLISKIPFCVILLFILISVFLMFFEANLMYYILFQEGIAGSQVKFSSWVYSILIVLLLLKIDYSIDENVTRNFGTLIGDYSYGVYLIHIFILSLIYKLCIVVFNDNYNVLLPFIAASITLVISVFMIYILNKCLPPFILKFLGLYVKSN